MIATPAGQVARGSVIVVKSHVEYPRTCRGTRRFVRERVVTEVVSTNGRVRMERIEAASDPIDPIDARTRIADRTAGSSTESYDDAFWRLVRLAHRRAYRILGVAADAEDVAAETLARASLRWRRLTHPADAWVSTVSTHLAIDRQRKAWRSLPLTDATADRMRLMKFSDIADGDRVDPDQRIDLARALADLPKRQRQVVGLAYLSGYTEAEIGELLGCSASSVQTHKKRGLQHLRAALGGPDDQPGPASATATRPDEEVDR